MVRIKNRHIVVVFLVLASLLGWYYEKELLPQKRLGGFLKAYAQQLQKDSLSLQALVKEKAEAGFWQPFFLTSAITQNQLEEITNLHPFIKHVQILNAKGNWLQGTRKDFSFWQQSDIDFIKDSAFGKKILKANHWFSIYPIQDFDHKLLGYLLLELQLPSWQSKPIILLSDISKKNIVATDNSVSAHSIQETSAMLQKQNKSFYRSTVDGIVRDIFLQPFDGGGQYLIAMTPAPTFFQLAGSYLLLLSLLIAIFVFLIYPVYLSKNQIAQRTQQAKVEKILQMQQKAVAELKGQRNFYKKQLEQKDFSTELLKLSQQPQKKFFETSKDFDKAPMVDAEVKTPKPVHSEIEKKTSKKDHLFFQDPLQAEAKEFSFTKAYPLADFQKKQQDNLQREFNEQSYSQQPAVALLETKVQKPSADFKITQQEHLKTDFQNPLIEPFPAPEPEHPIEILEDEIPMEEDSLKEPEVELHNPNQLVEITSLEEQPEIEIIEEVETQAKESSDHIAQIRKRIFSKDNQKIFADITQQKPNLAFENKTDLQEQSLAPTDEPLDLAATKTDEPQEQPVASTDEQLFYDKMDSFMEQPPAHGFGVFFDTLNSYYQTQTSNLDNIFLYLKNALSANAISYVTLSPLHDSYQTVYNSEKTSILYLAHDDELLQLQDKHWHFFDIDDSQKENIYFYKKFPLSFLEKLQSIMVLSLKSLQIDGYLLAYYFEENMKQAMERFSIDEFQLQLSQMAPALQSLQPEPQEVEKSNYNEAMAEEFRLFINKNLQAKVLHCFSRGKIKPSLFYKAKEDLEAVLNKEERLFYLSPDHLVFFLQTAKTAEVTEVLQKHIPTIKTEAYSYPDDGRAISTYI